MTFWPQEGTLVHEAVRQGPYETSRTDNAIARQGGFCRWTKMSHYPQRKQIKVTVHTVHTRPQPWDLWLNAYILYISVTK